MLGAWTAPCQRGPPWEADLRRHRGGDTMAAAVHHAMARMPIATKAPDVQAGSARGAAGVGVVAR